MSPWKRVTQTAEQAGQAVNGAMIVAALALVLALVAVTVAVVKR